MKTTAIVALAVMVGCAAPSQTTVYSGYAGDDVDADKGVTVECGTDLQVTVSDLRLFGTGRGASLMAAHQSAVSDALATAGLDQFRCAGCADGSPCWQYIEVPVKATSAYAMMSRADDCDWVDDGAGGGDYLCDGLIVTYNDDGRAVLDAGCDPCPDGCDEAVPTKGGE